MDVFGNGEWVPLQAVVGSVSPVAVVADYLAVRREDMDGSPLTRFQFTMVFKRCLSLGWGAARRVWYPFVSYWGSNGGVAGGLANVDVQRIGVGDPPCYAGYVLPDLIK